MTYPQPPPRELPKGAFKNLYLTDARSIVAMVSTFTGLVFLAVAGIGLSAGTNEAFAMVFFGVAVIELALAGVMGWFVLRKNGPKVRVLREGHATQATVTDIKINYNVRINRKHPIAIHYEFNVLGQNYTGHAQTLNQQLPYQSGDEITIVYDRDNPKVNVAWDVW